MYLAQDVCKNKVRLITLDMMLGIAMLLVVLGHHLLPIMPKWYLKTHYYIYIFHMPLFIFLSGFLISYTYKNIPYRIYVWRKFQKFFPAYITVGALCIWLGNPQVSVGNFTKEMLLFLISPKDSEAVFLWYIYLLMIFYVIAPFILRVIRSKRLPLLILSCIGLSFLDIHVTYFCIDYFCRYFPYCLGGMILAEHLQSIHIRWEWGIIPLFIFIVLSYVHFRFGYSPLLNYSLSWLSIPTVFTIATIIQSSRLMRCLFVKISKGCYGIYLLHLFFVQGIYLIVCKFLTNLSTEGAIIYLTISTTLSITLALFAWNIASRVIRIWKTIQ